MRDDTRAGGDFGGDLRAALEDDDIAAWNVVMGEVYQVAERVGNRRLYAREQQRAFPGWASEDLLKRRAAARAPGTRKDPLAYAADVVHTKHAASPDAEQRQCFRGIIANVLSRSGIRDFLRYWKRYEEDPKVDPDVEPDEIKCTKPAGQDAQAAAQHVFEWYKAKSFRAWVVIHLRYYNLHTAELPGDVVLHIRAVQGALEGGGLLGLSANDGLDKCRAAVETLLSNEAVLDGRQCVRWEVVASLLNAPRGVLETEASRMRNRYAGHLQERPPHD